MTNEEAIKIMSQTIKDEEGFLSDDTVEAHKMAIKALDQQPITTTNNDEPITVIYPTIVCDDAISREDATAEFIKWQNEVVYAFGRDYLGVRIIQSAIDIIRQLPPVTPQQKYGKCKDCKWWRDSDGVYRRGIGAESKCPINNVSVNHGFGYCYMFEPQESEG